MTMKNGYSQGANLCALVFETLLKGLLLLALNLGSCIKPPPRSVLIQGGNPTAALYFVLVLLPV